MDILYTVDDCGFSANSLEELKEKIKDFCTVGGYSPEVTIENNVVRVHIDEAEARRIDIEFDKIAELCTNGKFEEAKPKLHAFLEKHPRYSEAYRIIAQLQMQEGKYDEAIDTNIDALRCNPRNPWALLLMGNIFLKYKNDLATAKKYYDKLLEYCPDNAIAINNLALLFMEQDKFDEAIPVFEKVLKTAKYPNAFYGLAMCYYKKNEFKKSFEIALKGARECDDLAENPGVMNELYKLLLADAQAITSNMNFMNVVLGIKDIIEEKCGMPIRIEKDERLKTSALLQYGPTHHRNYHLIIYNNERPFTEHLIVHELMHLEMMQEATAAGTNKVVYHNSDNEVAFRTRYANWLKKLTAKIGHSKAVEISSSVLTGLVLQSMNCPLDLFVENRMFKKYPAMRPMQLLSLMALEQQNISSMEGSYKAKFIPQSILDASKIMNVVGALNLHYLYGIKVIAGYKPTKLELKKALDLYDEFGAYDDYKPGEEYELISYFAEELNIEDFFSMTDEDSYKRDTMERQEATDALKRMALGENESEEGNSFDGLSEEQKQRQDNFYENNKDGEDGAKTFMMAMYMLGALESFDGMPKSEIGKIAFEIAMIGTRGISPEKKSGYKVSAFPDKDFGGYQLLAYYYVSWALAYPEKLPALGLPFDTAWQTAQEMWKKKKGGN